MKEECRPADGDDDDDDEDCETKTVKKCGMEERERCVLGIILQLFSLCSAITSTH